MLQSDRYQQTLHLPPASGDAVEAQTPDSLNPSDLLVTALKRQFEIDNEEPERWDGLS